MATSRFDLERRAAAEGVLVTPRPDLAVFAVTGGDRLSWLNGLVTCEVSKLARGEGAYGLAVGKTGRIMAELWLVAGADRVLVALARERLAAIREHFERHLIMEDAEIGEALDRDVVFAHGPRAGALVGEARALGGDAAMIDWTGRGDAAVIVATEGKRGRERVLEVAVAWRGGAPAEVASDEAWEALRVAWGLPRAGVDFDDQAMPQEASLEKVAVCFSKGCYLGQEAVFMLEKRGHARRRLMRLFVEGEDDVAPGGALAGDEEPAAGAVTSATRAFDGKGWLALGYVKHKLTVPYTRLSLGDREVRVMGPAAEPHKHG